MENTVYILALISLAIIYLIIKGFHQPLTQKQYLFNIYMHILLIIIVWGVGALLINENKEKILHTLKGTKLDCSVGIQIIAILIMSFLSIYMIGNSETNIGRYLWWGTFIVTFGLIFYPLLVDTIQRNIFWSIIKSLLVVLILLSIISYWADPHTFTGWGPYLFIMLVGLIVFEIIDMITLRNISYKSFARREKIYGWITIILFSAFVLHDTQVLINKGHMFETAYKAGFNVNPNYAFDSLGLFLDIANMFAGMGRIRR